MLSEGVAFITGDMLKSTVTKGIAKDAQDVVIRNPTHYAVALKYKINEDIAPKVVAKGQDFVAGRIVKIAEENNVPTVENVQLARALYATAEVDSYIPGEYYGAIAEILAVIYTANEKNGK